MWYQYNYLQAILNDLGITLIGDVITILKHAIFLTTKSNADKLNNHKGLAKKLKSETQPISTVKKVVEVKKTEGTKSEKKKVTKRPDSS